MFGKRRMSQAGTVLIAVGDGTLADSLRFSLELEGYETRFCDERALSPLLRSPCLNGACMVLDQDVFSRVAEAGGTEFPCNPCVPVILMVSQKTDRLLAKAKTRGVTKVLEKPVLGGLMLETIRQVIENNENKERAVLPS
jgi:DNA-binding NtrC family response regulator